MWGSRSAYVALAPGDVLIDGDGRVLARDVALRVVGEHDRAERARAGGDAHVEHARLWIGGRPPPRPRRYLGVGLTLSALGGGVDVATPIHDRLNLRVGLRTFRLRRAYVDDGVTYAGTLTLRSFTASLDWFVRGGLHVSPGVMIYNGNRATGRATVPPGAMFRVHHTDLRSDLADPVSGTATIEFARVAPALMIGWGNLVPRGRRRWSVPVELGVVYARPPTTTIELHGTACDPDGDPCRDITREPLLQGQVELREAEVDAEIARLRFLPVVSIAFGYVF